MQRIARVTCIRSFASVHDGIAAKRAKSLVTTAATQLSGPRGQKDSITANQTYPQNLERATNDLAKGFRPNVVRRSLRALLYSVSHDQNALSRKLLYVCRYPNALCENTAVLNQIEETMGRLVTRAIQKNRECDLFPDLITTLRLLPRKAKMKPSRQSYQLFLEYCSRRGNAKAAASIWNEMKIWKVQPDVLALNHTLEALVSPNDTSLCETNLAHSILKDEQKENRIRPTHLSYALVMKGYAREARFDVLFSMLQAMEKHVTPTHETFRMIAYPMLHGHRYESVMQVWGYFRDFYPKLAYDHTTFHIVLSACAAHGRRGALREHWIDYVDNFSKSVRLPQATLKAYLISSIQNEPALVNDVIRYTVLHQICLSQDSLMDILDAVLLYKPPNPCGIMQLYPLILDQGIQPCVTLLAKLIQVHNADDKGSTSETFIRDMIKKGIKVDHALMTGTLRAYQNSDDIYGMERMAEVIIQYGYVLNTSDLNTLLTGYINLRQWAKAEKIFALLERGTLGSGSAANPTTYHVVMIGYLKEGDYGGVERTWIQLHDAGFIPSLKILATYLTSLINSRHFSRVDRLFRELRRGSWQDHHGKVMQPNLYVYQLMLKSYSYRGDEAGMLQILSYMRDEAMEVPDQVYAVLMRGFHKAAHLEAVARVRSLMRQTKGPSRSSSEALYRMLLDHQLHKQPGTNNDNPYNLVE